MSEVIKGVLGGSWTLLTGWILPCLLGLTLVNFLILPSAPHVPLLKDVLTAAPKAQALVVLTSSVVLGLALAALASLLYRVLEGYLLWPKRWQQRRIKWHRRRRETLRARSTASPGSTLTVLEALRVEACRRYPESVEQFAPTRLGNAIRRLEWYAQDRYQLDSQLLWSHLRSAVDESVRKEVDDARAGVDFFVCLLWVSAGWTVAALAALLSPDRDVGHLLFAVAVGAAVVIGCYQGAVRATDAWASAVRAMVDIGRLPMAAKLGITIPRTFEAERQMWERIGWFMGFDYDVRAAVELDPYRSVASASADAQVPDSERKPA